MVPEYRTSGGIDRGYRDFDTVTETNVFYPLVADKPKIKIILG